MIEYHKIQSVYLRDPANKFRTFLEGQWACPEFGYLADCEWTFTEKIDGTNVRVYWDGANVKFGGRTDDAQMPMFLLERLSEVFTADKLASVLGPQGDVTLFGEGYGAKIQKGGGNYIPNGCSFILFDIAGGETWFERSKVEETGDALDIPIVPVVGRGCLRLAIDMVRSGFNSWRAATPETQAEGLVMRPSTELRTRMGHRIITKVKAKDFRSQRAVSSADAS